MDIILLQHELSDYGERPRSCPKPLRYAIERTPDTAEENFTAFFKFIVSQDMLTSLYVQRSFPTNVSDVFKLINRFIIFDLYSLSVCMKSYMYRFKT